MASGSGSTIGPDGALYVTEGAAGRVVRVDPHSGHFTTYAFRACRSPSSASAARCTSLRRPEGLLVTLVGP